MLLSACSPSSPFHSPVYLGFVRFSRIIMNLSPHFDLLIGRNTSKTNPRQHFVDIPTFVNCASCFFLRISLCMDPKVLRIRALEAVRGSRHTLCRSSEHLPLCSVCFCVNTGSQNVASTACKMYMWCCSIASTNAES